MDHSCYSLTRYNEIEKYIVHGNKVETTDKEFWQLVSIINIFKVMYLFVKLYVFDWIVSDLS